MRVFLVEMDHKEPLETRVHREFREFREFRVPRVGLAGQESLEIQVPLDKRAGLVPRVGLDQLDPLD
jgi:hypothetical protein